MPGAELLQRLLMQRQRRSAAEDPREEAHCAASRVPKVAPSPEDEWTTDEKGRRVRIRAAAPAMPAQQGHTDADEGEDDDQGDKEDSPPCRHGINTKSCLVCRTNGHEIHGRDADGRGTNGLGAVAGMETTREGEGGGGGAGAGAGGGEAFASTVVGGDDAVMRTLSAQSRLAEHANAAANQHAVATPLEDDEAAGWELVRMHNSEYASWIVIGGRVLDVTGYLGHHPGGVKVIQKLSGRDATRAYEKARHSRAADMKLDDFTIGKLGDLKRLRRAAQRAQESRERLEAAAKYL
jgi:cytochrome b involved in lipid metabolism